jgi:uncharacterized protein (DUF1810 family)
LRGLGRSELAQQCGLAGRAEAETFAAHPLLGLTLVTCVQAMLGHPQRSAVHMLGAVDAMKFRSCLTLFAEVVSTELCFRQRWTASTTAPPNRRRCSFWTVRATKGCNDEDDADYRRDA